jgi:hypothetical protein
MSERFISSAPGQEFYNPPTEAPIDKKTAVKKTSFLRFLISVFDMMQVHVLARQA